MFAMSCRFVAVGELKARLGIVTKITNEDRPGFREYLEKLEGLGCEYERGDVGDTAVYALNIPPKPDIGEVYETLDGGEKAAVWGWGTGFDGHPSDGSE